MINKEKFKWIAVFTALILLFAGVITYLAIAIGNKPVEVKTEGQDVSAAAEDNPMVMLTMGNATIFRAAPEVSKVDTPEQVYVSQTVTATITPSTVVDKYVTWSVAWANDAPLKDKNISDYIKVTDDSQGNLTATVNCYKSFKGSKAILTCTTRQGGKTGTVNIVYEGVPSSMSITAPTGVTKYNLGKDSVDLLYVGKSYSLNLAMDNIFHSVGSNFNDFTVTVTGVGSVTCGSYSQSGRGAGYILLILAVITVIGVVAHFTNGFTSDFKTFYVTVDGKDVMTSSGGYKVTTEKPLQVDVKYTFNFATDETKNYSVKIVPNKIENSDFTYTVDGESKSFQSQTDLTAAFAIDKGEKSFTVKPKGKSLTEVLTAFYGTEVTDCENKGYMDMFTIIVTSYNGEASVKLNFTIAGKVVGVVLDREVIVF